MYEVENINKKDDVRVVHTKSVMSYRRNPSSDSEPDDDVRTRRTSARVRKPKQIFSFDELGGQPVLAERKLRKGILIENGSKEVKS